MSGRGSIFGLLAVLAASLPAPAGGASLWSGPARPGESQSLTLLLAAQGDEPGRTPLEDVQVNIDGAPTAVEVEAYSDHARRQTTAEPGWKPGMVMGVLFFWGQGAPQEMLDGLPKLTSRFPPATPVYPVPYGEGYPSFVMPRAAADIAGGELDTLSFIPGERPVLFRALEFARQELLKHPADLRLLVVITDGRDAERGSDPAAFRQLGEQLVASGLVVQVVTFPAATQPAEGLANAAALARGAQGRHARAGSAADLPALIESASLVYLDMKRVTISLPFGLRALGGQRTLVVNARAGGKPVRAELRAVVLPGPARWWLAGAVLVLTLVTSGLLWRFSLRGGAGSRSELLTELQRQVRLGSPPQRIVADLSRRFPRDVHRVGRVDPTRLPSDAYQVLKSAAGQERLVEIKAALAASLAEEPGQEVVDQLAGAVTAGSDAAATAAHMRASLPDGVCAAFARRSFREVVAMLKQGAVRHPQLGTAAARQLALGVQDALRSGRGDAVVVAWLVRASGPGRRGETLALQREGTVIGRSEECDVCLTGDPQVADQHATLFEQSGAFVIRALAGQVVVEAEPIHEERRLADGETIDLGAGAYVFKSVVAD